MGLRFQYEFYDFHSFHNMKQWFPVVLTRFGWETVCLNCNCSFRKSDLKIQWGGLKVGRWLLIFILQEADLALRGPGAFLEASFQDAMGRSESDPLTVDDGAT